METVESIHLKWCEIARINGYDESWYREDGPYDDWYRAIIEKEPSDAYFEYYLDDLGGYVDDFAISIAVIENRLSIVKMLIERGFKPDHTAIEFAYSHNRIDCLGYLLDINGTF